MLWSAWYPYVLPEAPGAPEPLLDHYIRQAAIDFFRESTLWTLDITPLNVVASTGTYTMVVPDQTVSTGVTDTPDISIIKWAWVDGVQIYPTSQEELNALVEKWSTKTASRVSNYTQLTQTAITLFPTPDFASTAGLTVKVAVQPSLTSLGVPDWLGSRYIDAISIGAKARLLGMVGRPWSNPAGEAKYGALYATLRTKSTTEGNRSFTRSTQTVRFPRYG